MTRISSYAQAVEWLFARNQFAMKLGLEGPRRLLSELGNPQLGPVYAHVAGTNGKGSVCVNLAALVAASGTKRVGLYTSPHLVSFRERIRVDGTPISPDWVTRWLDENMPVLEALNPTYFECVTALAFAYFAAQDCRAVVLETGLGGRLDATNIVTPKVTVITSISWDHMQVLGDTLEAIWGEKLGIVKPGVPLCIDESRLHLAALAARAAAAAAAPLCNLADRLTPETDGLRVQGRYSDYFLAADLRPEAHQLRNAALSLLAFEAYRSAALPPAWLSALRTARMPGRTQWLAGEGRLPVLLDGAHNSGGMDSLCGYLAGLGRGRPRFFFAAMRDKEVAALYRRLRAVSHDIVYLELGDAFPRALRADELRAQLKPEELHGLRVAPVAWEALAPLLRPGEGADFAVVCGSLYLLGEVIPKLLPHYRGLEEFAQLLAEEETHPR